MVRHLYLKLRTSWKLAIGTLAKAAGVNVETIRFYQRRGLLQKPPKPEEGYRRYPVEALKLEIADLLFLGQEGELSCTEMLDLANRKIGQIEHKIKALEVMKATLIELAEKCPGTGNLALSPIWERMASLEERKEVDYMAKKKVEVFIAVMPCLLASSPWPWFSLYMVTSQLGQAVAWIKSSKSVQNGQTAAPADNLPG